MAQLAAAVANVAWVTGVSAYDAVLIAVVSVMGEHANALARMRECLDLKAWRHCNAIYSLISGWAK